MQRRCNDHFVQIQNEERNALKSLIHHVDAVLTVLCNGTRSDSLWLGCPTCAVQFIQLFRVRLFWDYKALEPAIAPSQKIRLLAKLRESMTMAR